MERKIIPGLDIAVGNIFCIGRNYALHAKELNNEIPENPLVFLKPTSSISYSGESIALLEITNDVHHEVELAVAIEKTAKNIPVKDAEQYIAGIGIGIDFTARDIQQQAKDKGHPWTLAKGLDGFAPIGNFVLPKSFSDLNNIEFTLSVNGTKKQTGNTSDMIFSISELIAYLSTNFTLQRGDLIFTGTPAGVSRVSSGDKVRAEIEQGISIVEVTIS